MSSIKLSESGFADDGDTEMEYKKAMLHKTHIEEIVDTEEPIKRKHAKHSRHGDGKHQSWLDKQELINLSFAPVED